MSRPGGALSVWRGHYKNLVFLSVGVVDSGSFKGASTLEELQAHTEKSLNQYVDWEEAAGNYPLPPGGVVNPASGNITDTGNIFTGTIAANYTLTPHLLIDGLYGLTWSHTMHTKGDHGACRAQSPRPERRHSTMLSITPNASPLRASSS